MRLYGGLIVAILAALFWPDRNAATTPFAELTFTLLGTTIFSLWLAYHAVRLGFESLSQDKFWPWRWTRRIVTSLAIRTGFLVAFFGGAWILSIGWPKFDRIVLEFPIICAIICFGFVTYCVCVDDKELMGEPPAPPQT